MREALDRHSTYYHLSTSLSCPESSQLYCDILFLRYEIEKRPRLVYVYLAPRTTKTRECKLFMLPLYFVSRVKQMISEGTESNLPPKSCTWRGQSTVSYKEKSLYCFNMISTWIARWSLEIKGSSSKLRLTRSMNSVVKWEIIASFSYDLYLDHRMALGDRGWYLNWPRDELNQLVRNISCLKIA